jgi:hypothetical protein
VSRAVVGVLVPSFVGRVAFVVTLRAFLAFVVVSTQ